MNKRNNQKQRSEKWNLLILIAALISVINITSCNSKTESTNETKIETTKQTDSFKIKNDSLEKVINSIIEIAATDFYKNQKPLPIEFRNVQIKYHIKPSSETLFILCGQFQTEDKTQWTQFATIKNSDYEQWIGPNGLTYSENSTEIPYTKKDLSTELKNKLNSLKELEK